MWPVDSAGQERAAGDPAVHYAFVLLLGASVSVSSLEQCGLSVASMSAACVKPYHVLMV